MIENRTPHDIHFLRSDGSTVTFPPMSADKWIRVQEIRERIGIVRDYGLEVPINRRRFDRAGATGVPEKRDGALYIVSQITADAFPERDDFIVPDEIERDGEGKITGCRAFARVWPGAYTALRDAAVEARAEIEHVTETKPR